MLFQIETDKVTIDVRAPQSGTLEEVLVGIFHQCKLPPAVMMTCMCAYHCLQSLVHLPAAFTRAPCCTLLKACCHIYQA